MCNGHLKRGGLVLSLLLGSVPSNLRNHDFRNRSLATQQLLESLAHVQRNTVLPYTRILTRRGRKFHRLGAVRCLGELISEGWFMQQVIKCGNV